MTSEVPERPPLGFSELPSSTKHPKLAEYRREYRRNSDVPISEPLSLQLLDVTDGEFRVNNHSTAVHSDLLLEIAMTTAFASLTEGTDMFEAWDVASYLSFFALVWWIWASQVAYNVRFRRADWMHRFFVFLQFFVFCGLAAFTRDFNITNGILDDSQKENEADILERQSYQDDRIAIPLLKAGNYRHKLLPKLNFRGISIVMALSRLLLLIQYSVVIGDNPGEDNQIVKLVLWFFPLFVEVAAHFVAISGRYKGWVRYSSELISERSATVFVIILGGGLDNITKVFQQIVGNVSFGWRSLGVIFSGVLIFLLLFALHFNTPQPESSRPKSESSEPTGKSESSEPIGKPESSEPLANQNQVNLENQGLGLGVLLFSINFWIKNATNQNPPDFNLSYNWLLSVDEEIIQTVLNNLDSYPDDDLLVAKMDAFYYASPLNYTLVNNQTFDDIVRSVIIENATPALWFYGSGGALLVTLGVLCLISQWPRDNFEWGQILSRILFGSFIIILSSLDLHLSRKNILTDNFHYGDSRIWFLAKHSWVLPPYALALLIEHIIELILLKVARHFYPSEPNLKRHKLAVSLMVILRNSNFELGMQIGKEAGLVKALANAEENERPNNGAIEINSDEEYVG
ncbi:hypothetical protein K435DRAFT_884399 [Dendrothele bispora CBS 962.96]|uniref:Uncharacterized protein n=1 Tax=Dendrothele bispora (strain CBS 962.96) TaxID=1314807 RepID=A0A4S8KUW7_DENBC|nr:hypothetical protein K435DRAFT_884399 [Dendrothele bispora CBS 962.96]